MESLQGGSFGNGFMAAGMTAALMPQVGRIPNDTARIITGALVGGTISQATGGKFASGTISGAIQAAMRGGSSRRTVAAKDVVADVEISDQSGAPEDIRRLLGDKRTRLAGFRKLAEYAGILVPPNQINYEDVDYFVTSEGRGAAMTDMKTGDISFSNAAARGDFWVTLSIMNHEYGHWMDWRFQLGSPELDQIRAYRFQIRDSNFIRTPQWYQDGIKKELLRQEDIFKCKEAATC